MVDTKEEAVSSEVLGESGDKKPSQGERKNFKKKNQKNGYSEDNKDKQKVSQSYSRAYVLVFPRMVQMCTSRLLRDSACMFVTTTRTNRT